AMVRAERGMILLPEDDRSVGNEWVEVLSDQLGSFTGSGDGEHDDIADALGMLGRIADTYRPGEELGDHYPYPAFGHDGYGMVGYNDRYGGDDYQPAQLGFNGDIYGGGSGRLQGY